RLDGETATAIETLKGDSLPEQSACGRIPISGLLQVARQRKMSIQRFDLRNSGDTSGDKRQVVGYGAWGLYE
ncbi:MAG: AmmeMemoRadiSam system protein B, partial [Candidatus Marinimicrobia bacterium]|nr:AmmeMemoRadiSam system protein B [Candidatus Neomarinimicrobiota bacterium]